MDIVLIFKAIVYGLLEGVTEWLPISSTGHLILLDGVFELGLGEEFFDLFEVVVQLGAVLAVPTCFGERVDPRRIFSSTDNSERKLWGRILVAILPSALVGLLLDDLLDAYLYRPTVVAIALIVYGVGFIFVERYRTRRELRGDGEIGVKEALGVGAFQTLALIPGTSRSGATMLGGLMLGLSRESSAEFSFLLAIPTMLGASGLRTVKFVLDGNRISTEELLVLLVGAFVAYITSLVVIKFLVGFVKRRGFTAFGIYRIALGAIVLLYFTLLKG